MGIAAYNRGTALINRTLDNEQASGDMEVIRRLGALTPGKSKLFQDTVIRRDGVGRWWIMDRPEEGWSSYGVPFNRVEDIIARFAIVVTGAGQDDCSFFYAVTAL